MSSGLVWLSVFLLFPLAGLPLLSHAAFRRFPASSRAILAGGVGAVLVSFSMTAFALLGVPWSLAGILISSVLLSLLLRLTVRETAPPPPKGKAPGAPGIAAAVLSAVAVTVAFLATATGAASSPDLIFFWGSKAQQFALAKTVDARFLAEPFLGYMHAYYPPLVTNLYALASMAAGRMSWTAATLVFPLLLAALALGLPGVLRTGYSPAASASISTLIVCALAYLGIEADIGGNGEMPLLFFETMAMAVLISPACAGAPGQLLAGLLLAGVATTKVEGLPFALAAAVLFLLVRRSEVRPGWKAAMRLGAPTVLALGAWFAFGGSRHLFAGYSGEGALLDLHLEHWKFVLTSIALAIAATGHGLPYLVPLVCLLLLAPRMTRLSVIPLGVAAALMAFLLFTYMDRPGDPSTWISWSAARVLSPLATLFALATVGARDATGRRKRSTRQSARVAPLTHKPAPTESGK
jgi:hypothetical protein